MGRYTQLYIGRLYFSWKGTIPSYLGFPFEEADMYSSWDEDDPSFLEAVGFQASAATVRDRLDRIGFSMSFCETVYTHFESDLRDAYMEEVGGEISRGYSDPSSAEEAKTVISCHVSSFPQATVREQILAFVDLLRTTATGDPAGKYYKSPYVERDEYMRANFVDHPQYSPQKRQIVSADEYLQFCSNISDSSVCIDFDKLSEYLINGYDRYPPWLIMLCLLFTREYLFIWEYPEIVWLVLIRLAVESVGDYDLVRLDLGDIVDSEEEARLMPVQLTHDLMEKLRLYNRSFIEFFRDEEAVRDRYMKATCRTLMAECDSADSAYEKGLALEKMVELLFTENGTLQISQKRVSTEDEEIDLVIRNSIDRPFWNAFSSPLFFVECKNWTAPVGTSAVRDFEGKIRNHNNLVTVGFFVSLNGFTKEVYSELKRGGRDSYHVVLLERSDITTYVGASQDFYTFLEAKTAQVY